MRSNRWAVISASAKARWARPATGNPAYSTKVPSLWLGASGYRRRASRTVQVNWHLIETDEIVRQDGHVTVKRWPEGFALPGGMTVGG